MTAIVIVGMSVGTLLILTAIAVFWAKRDFPIGGLGALLVGFILIGMSQWQSINFKGLGFEIQVLREQLQSTAAAADQVAGQVQQTATAVEATRTQIAALKQILASRNIGTAAALEQIDRTLEAALRPDLAQLGAARARLADVVKHTQRRL
jgi:hypothetical protein